MIDPIGRDEDGVVCMACLSDIGPWHLRDRLRRAAMHRMGGRR